MPEMSLERWPRPGLKSDISMRTNILRYFHASLKRFGRWTAAEDELLLQKHKEFGPAWTALSLEVISRSPTECRRRWLTISGALENLSDTERKLIYEDGYEKYGNQLIKIPQERIVAGPFAKLAAAVEPVGFRSQRRQVGWGTMERLAVREGYEQYGPSWTFIARKLQYRTGRQCRNMMMRRYVECNEDKLETITLGSNEQVKPPIE